MNLNGQFQLNGLPFVKVRTIHWVCIILYVAAPIVALCVMLGRGSSVGFGVFFVFCLFLIPAGIHYLAIVGLRKNSTWGRVLSLILGFILLFYFPIGTIAGIYMIFQMGSKYWVQNI